MFSRRSRLALALAHAALVLALVVGGVAAPATAEAGRAGGKGAEPRRRERANAATVARKQVHAELDAMARRLGPAGVAASDLEAIRTELDGSLRRIDGHIEAGRIVPGVELVRHDPTIALPREVEALIRQDGGGRADARRAAARRKRPVRVGVLPTAFNPPHWGHVGVALSAMDRRQLDHVVFVPAGADPRKPNLVPVEQRHPIAADVIRLFGPLMSYSPIAVQTGLDGESNLFRLLGLNLMDIEVDYLFGDDHYQEFYKDERGKDDPNRPDTLTKLRRNIAARASGFDPTRQRVNGLVLQRDAAHLAPVDVGYEVARLPGLSFKASSTAIRESLDALASGGLANPRGLALLPHGALQAIERIGLYGIEPAP